MTGIVHAPPNNEAMDKAKPPSIPDIGVRVVAMVLRSSSTRSHKNFFDSSSSNSGIKSNKPSPRSSSNDTVREHFCVESFPCKRYSVE